jgi:hypothetical protein
MLNPDVIVDISFYKTENGGRKGPTPPNFFACIFVIDGQNHDCRLLLENVGSVYPGEGKSNVPIKFWCPELVLPKIDINKKFLLRDGQVIAEGKVIKIVS